MASEFRRTRRVEFADTDAAGIIHFAQYFRYMEETEHAFLRSLGLSVDLRLEATGEGEAFPAAAARGARRPGSRRLGFPRLAARCEFLQPLKFEDEVEIHLRVLRKGRASLTYQFLFERGGETVARGELSAACCECGPDGFLRSTLLPDVLAGRIEESSCEPLAFRPAAGPAGGPDL